MRDSLREWNSLDLLIRNLFENQLILSLSQKEETTHLRTFLQHEFMVRHCVAYTRPIHLNFPTVILR